MTTSEAGVRIGVFGDVHGSLADLTAIWQALANLGLSEGPVLNAGDNVGYGDDPEGCVAFLRAHPNVVTVQGNYDKNVALYPERCAEYRKKWGRARPEKFEALRRDSEVISDDTRSWLLGLPKEVTVTLGGVRVLLTHYAPGSKEGLGRWTPDSRLAELAGQTDARVVVCGHTHSPFVREAGGVLFVNPGTVGRSLYGRPSYAVLTLAADRPPSAALRSTHDETGRD